MSRYLDAKAFLDEAKALKVTHGHLSDTVLERLEKQRSLIPRLRLHYPDPIERRWWAQDHEGYDVGGIHEPEGQLWEDANALEQARQKRRWEIDPTVTPHPLDDPEARFLPFIEHPAELPFVAWRDYRVSVNAEGAKPFYASQTVVTYYSSWQLLQYAEVATMGVTALMNLLEFDNWPSAEAVAAVRVPHASCTVRCRLRSLGSARSALPSTISRHRSAVCWRSVRHIMRRDRYGGS
ncbi:hypothetical protein [Sphingomonas faeni]|uniref:hypothetical protein n=1 Tax=Sphingomonas faeni TaxID=185950 RepID=UPI00335815C6